MVLALWCAAAPISGREPSLGRVEVMAPSTPRTDVYTTVAVVARTETWDIDRDFRGEAWLWTDGPWIRPFHVKFVAADRGVIFQPLKFELPALQRIEAYSLTGVIQSWSDPVFPVADNYRGPRLFWGKLGDCAAPGLDFCIAEHGERPPAAGPGKPALGVPLLITGLSKQAGAETWHIIINPGLDPAAQTALVENLKAAAKPEKILEIFAEQEGGLLLAVPPVGKGLALPPHLLVVTGQPDDASPAGGFMEGFKNSWPAARGRGTVMAAVADRDGWIGVWSEGDEAPSIWKALGRGDAYASWGGRTFIDWKGNFSAAAANGALRIMVAGRGPREEVSLLRDSGGELGQAASWSTDDFRLDRSFRGAAPGGASRFFIAVTEPGSPRGSHALAGPLLIK
ncbi:MAG TPA: hypothetical protein VM658_11745 [bacterium]|nr:hypothetical protein [bacterium]